MYCGLHVCGPSDSDVDIILSGVMILADGACAEGLGHEGGALMNGICALVKKTPESSCMPPTM